MPPLTSTSIASTSTTSTTVAIVHIAPAAPDYGSGVFDTVSRWTSLALAALVAMLGTRGFLLRRARDRGRTVIISR